MVTIVRCKYCGRLLNTAEEKEMRLHSHCVELNKNQSYFKFSYKKKNEVMNVKSRSIA